MATGTIHPGDRHCNRLRNGKTDTSGERSKATPKFRRRKFLRPHFISPHSSLSSALVFTFFLSACASSGFSKKVLSDPRYQIQGSGTSSGDRLALWLLDGNSALKPDFALYIALTYIEEARREHINHDVAFVQMCLETGFLTFRGSVNPGSNNFAGIGAVDHHSQNFAKFSSARDGIRAHIQHLKAYANTKPLLQARIDPRFAFVQRGCCPTIFHLTGKWSTDRSYGKKLKNLLDKLYQFP